ncbi:bifunctional lysylphosphatidylglycerol flippase/synthetase MprF [Pedobacter gandavensis]|uniref:bifunctional lysylphosphatidylglycerol flippase/synthetase MprF n=1 Tax=Pedobacter gandavensis TaxID=2679963 RepID=UPI00247926F9|nr:bifunctional lysylphosphatidylglycerol flippase/synthetase MprF [Pedobacter gandavensis]WGQ09386.1 bifunctional lysylphosphatidylglycerol flippase/synthetase MprF [Pedobacter gandavensis]
MKRFKFFVPFLRENGKIISSYVFSLFFIGLAIWFINQERGEIRQVEHLLGTAKWVWVTIGIALSIVYVFIHGMMYRSSFAAVSSKISIGDGTLLFLKRNFISVFLPAGGVSSLAFFSSPIEQKGVSKSQINFASSIYGFVGILSVLVIAIPVFIYAILEGSIGYGEWFGLIAAILLMLGIYLLYRSVIQRGPVYRFIIKYIPVIEVYAAEFRNNKIERKHFIATFLYSSLIELVGIVHIYIAMLALDLPPSWMNAVISYIVAVVFLIISPFLRGLGAVEASMTFILIRLGYPAPQAVSITFLYRFMEFWIPMFIGAMSFLFRINKLLMRVVPALFLLLLGLINVVSVLTPAIHSRLRFVKDFIPMEAITASNYFVLVAGLFLLVTAAFMLKGLRTAWYFAMALCLLSLVGHLSKAIDYEEAGFSVLVMIILMTSRKEYYIRNNAKLRSFGIQTTLLSILGIMIYGTIGFYFLDKKHFNIDFSWTQSIRYTLENFILIGSDDLQPMDHFARGFLYSINISGFLSIGFLIYTLIRPYISSDETEEAEFERANQLLEKYGNSGIDYFKTYQDKLIYFSESMEGFVAYRIAGNFAVVLECPVTAIENRRTFIKDFDRYCFENGMKSLYYRVPEESLEDFLDLGKKRLFLGQEGLVDLTSFSLEGGSKKSIRNALKKVSDQGYHTKIYEPPIKDGLLQKIKSVSDGWLEDMDREELVFSQGMFNWEELKEQTIITVENAEEKIVAFMNVIPDYAPGEGTYDLIRKTSDAPNGIIDFIMVALFEHLKAKGCTKVNLGFAPMSGLIDPHNFPERSMKFAYEKIRSFSHYKGLRASKEKFAPEWQNRYLIYDHDYDLLQVPTVLTKVIKP